MDHALQQLDSTQVRKPEHQSAKYGPARPQSEPFLHCRTAHFDSRVLLHMFFSWYFHTHVSFLCSRKVALQKFDTNKLQKPCQYCVEVQVYVDLMKQSPPDESTIWEDVDGSATQLVSCRGICHWFVSPCGFNGFAHSFLKFSCLISQPHSRSFSLSARWFAAARCGGTDSRMACQASTNGLLSLVPKQPKQPNSMTQRFRWKKTTSPLGLHLHLP